MDTLQNFIAGRWTEAPERKPAVNPATGQQIAWLPKSDRAIAREAIAAAKAARATWAKTSVWKRAEMCVAIADSIDESRSRIAVGIRTSDSCPRAPRRGTHLPKRSKPKKRLAFGSRRSMCVRVLESRLTGGLPFAPIVA
jgi:hypothetical protein